MEQLLILAHMVVDIVLDHLCISTNSRNEISMAQKYGPTKLRFCSPCTRQMNRTLALEISNHLRNSVFGRNR